MVREGSKEEVGCSSVLKDDSSELCGGGKERTGLPYQTHSLNGESGVSGDVNHVY